MIILSNRRSSMRALAMAAILAAGLSARTDAGGPLFITDGRPVLWADYDVRGGPLNSQTVGVDHHGRRTVYYHVDSGPLGPLSNEEARRLVDRIWGEYTAIPTADITFANAGPLRDPDTGAVVNVDGTNYGKFADELAPTFQNPIIFDDDGSITGSGGILGFFGALTFAPGDTAVYEGIVVLNGPPISILGTTPYLGVFVHEFGHLAGPLDHAQANGNIARGDPTAILPPGFDRPRAYDLFAPFIETMLPFILGAPAGATQTMNSGYFTATIDMDTANALSNLYPMRDYEEETGAIEGQVDLFSGGVPVPVPGINVVARRIDQGIYPPPLGTVAYPTPPTFDEDGVPSAPPPQAATDSLATFSSAVTGLDFGFGTYRIQGLPPGEYMVQVQRINPAFVAGSGIGPGGSNRSQPFLPVREQYFDRPHTSEVATEFRPVRVRAGKVTRSIDMEIHGFDGSEPQWAHEVESHFTIPTAQALATLPALVTGEASEADPSAISLFGEGINDLYLFSIPAKGVVWISLEHLSGQGDIDLFAFPAGLADPIPPSQILFSASATNDELISVPLPAGSWYVGVGAFAGDVKYRLRILQDMPLAITAPHSIAGDYPAVFQPWSSRSTNIVRADIQYGDGMDGNLDGCAPFAAGSLTGKIVLVDRGICGFSIKISNIAAGGGRAGLIGLVTPDPIFEAGFSGGTPTVPGFIIHQATSEAIKEKLRKGVGARLIVPSAF